MSYRDYDAESFFARAAKDSQHQAPARIQELPPVPLSLLRREPTDPTPGYLEERARLGMPSGTKDGLLETACPWCGRGQLQPCANPVTGQLKRQAHDARYEAAGIKPPQGGPARLLALEQAAESRSARFLT